jgi:CheY-like chemotaxis protein
MKNILVVDDNPLNAKLAAIILSRAGHAVRTAAGVAEALDLLAQSMPDVVVTDISMPGVTGTQMCRELRERFPGNALWIVAYTALAMQDELRDIEGAGFDAIVIKPATKEALLAAIRAADAPSSSPLPTS